jgi:UMF1 family MFS transporter
MNEAAAAPRASKAVIAWAFYDWVNSAFATTVITAFFPLLLKRLLG